MLTTVLERDKQTMIIDFEHGLTENVDAEDAHNTMWSECECEACTETDPVAVEFKTWKQRRLAQAEAMFGKIGSSRHDGPDRIF